MPARNPAKPRFLEFKQRRDVSARGHNDEKSVWIIAEIKEGLLEEAH